MIFKDKLIKFLTFINLFKLYYFWVIVSFLTLYIMAMYVKHPVKVFVNWWDFNMLFLT